MPNLLLLTSSLYHSSPFPIGAGDSFKCAKRKRRRREESSLSSISSVSLPLSFLPLTQRYRHWICMYGVVNRNPFLSKQHILNVLSKKVSVGVKSFILSHQKEIFQDRSAESVSQQKNIAMSVSVRDTLLVVLRLDVLFRCVLTTDIDFMTRKDRKSRRRHRKETT